MALPSWWWSVLAEVFPALREKLCGVSGCLNQRNARPRSAVGKHGAYRGYRDAGDAPRDAGFGAGCEEELVVFTAVEGRMESGGECERTGEWMQRQCGGVDAGGEAGLFAEVGEIGGEAVGEVDAGCG